MTTGIWRLKLIGLMGINMISNNDVVKIFTIRCHITNSVHGKHNEYSDECTIPFEYIFTWHYTVGARKICRLELTNRL